MLPVGANSFLLEEYPFQKGSRTPFKGDPFQKTVWWGGGGGGKGVQNNFDGVYILQNEFIPPKVIFSCTACHDYVYDPVCD